MDFVKQAAENNQQGAAFCANGDLQNAFQCFRMALRILSTGAATFDETRNVELVSDMGYLHKLTSSSSDGRQHDLLASSDAQPYFVFQEAILFDADSESITTSHIALFLAVIEFNMALTFHLRSFQVGKKAHMASKALNLYDYCLLHLTHATRCSEASGVLMAALSNKAQIMNQEFGNYQELHQMYDSLTRAVAYCYVKPGLFTAKDIEEFLLNIVIIRELKFAAAA